MLQLLLSPIAKYVAIAAVLGVGGLYIKAKLTDIATLRHNNEVLKATVEQQKEVIAIKTQEFEQVRDAINEMQELNEALTTDLEQLRTKFNKRKPDGSVRDVGKLAVAKDGLIEKVINRGTNRVFDCLERLTADENVDNDTCNRTP